MSTIRTPASVLESPTEILPAARSTSRQRSAVASPIRRPAKTSVAMQRAAARRSARLRLGVELGRGVEQRVDLLGAVEADRPLALRLQLAVAGVDADRVARDQIALLGDGEDLPEPGDRLVDRLRAERTPRGPCTRGRSRLRSGMRARAPEP